MGNCQATEAAMVVIQHPGGRVERLYWPTCAAEVMRSNPGHYVAHVTMYFSAENKKQEESTASGGLRVTRVRLLKPKDTLFLGQVYRLISSHEVAKALRARKQEKMRKNQAELKKQQQQQQRQKQQMERTENENEELVGQADEQKIDEAAMQERDRQRSKHPAVRARQWRPSLQSISEVVS